MKDLFKISVTFGEAEAAGLFQVQDQPGPHMSFWLSRAKYRDPVFKKCDEGRRGKDTEKLKWLVWV